MIQVLFLQGIMLEIAHHGVQLGHTIADRRTCSEYHAFAAGDLIEITALHEHIRRFLCIGGGKSGNIPHFCVEKQVLVIVCLIYIQSVNAQLLKGNHIILAGIILQFR